MINQVLPALISATGGGVLVALINFVLARPKARAEAAQIAGETAASMLTELRLDLTSTRKRVHDVEVDNRKLRVENRELHEHVWRIEAWIRRTYVPREGDDPMPELRTKGT